MSDLRTILERGVGGATPPPDGFERMLRRRDRKRRNQRIAAGLVGIAVFVAALGVVTTGFPFDQSQKPAVQPTPTPPAATAPETGYQTGYLIDLNTAEMTQLQIGRASCRERVL